ncbi:MAG: [protein-PII] uridylyltransferase [Verrucomicrobiales bacterium]|jgi:[protein-PII] uridylyltransferase
MKSRAELLQLYKRFFRLKNRKIKRLHREGAGGLEIARLRAELLDGVLRDVFAKSLETLPDDAAEFPVTLVAFGGYGRGTLNPSSDVDLLFLCPKNTHRLPAETKDMIGEIITMLFDVGLQVGHAVRSVGECVQEANRDNTIKTSMLDLRFIAGDEELVQKLEQRFLKQCIKGKEADYLSVRMRDFHKRHAKNAQTVFLQEPQIKEGCGGLRDFQNIIWILKVRYGADDLQYLVDQKLLTEQACQAMNAAHEFLMRVRNEMHYTEGTDILTLRLQGEVATNLRYPDKTMLRRIEAFMRDYYEHTRSISNHSTSLLQAFDLLAKDEATGIVSYLARRRRKREEFDGFVSHDGLLFPEHENIFSDDPNRLMRTFVHLQQRGLRLGPEIRKLFKNCRDFTDRAFLYHKDNRSAFEAILSRKGEVAVILREMHRVGFLGEYLPEFGALELLVQHEFFHRYTADEHTLRCIDVLDSLMDSEELGKKLFRQLFQDSEDPFILYLALILHDTGRAENKQFHDDASVELTVKVCRRFQIKGQRRQRVLFLVDHHLTFWRTATSKDIDDPQTVSEFAGMMRSRSNMESLLLFTYVDSNGTNDEAWSAWKESLMLRLYHSTCRFFEDEKEFERGVRDAKSELRAEATEKLSEDYADDVDAHFSHMPERYFFFRDSVAVIRHIKLFRRFIRRTLKTTGFEGLRPALAWIPNSNGGYSEMELCCWNRHLMLAKVAGVLAAREINILSADIFSRDDDLVLDVFRVCTTNFEPITNEREQNAVQQLLDDLMDTTADIESIASKIAPGATARVNEELLQTFPARIGVNNVSNDRYTVLEVEAQDRIGLLYDIFMAIGASEDVEVQIARICTEKGAAVDTFFLTDNQGRKIAESEHQRIAVAINQAIGLPDASQT